MVGKVCKDTNLYVVCPPLSRGWFLVQFWIVRRIYYHQIMKYLKTVQSILYYFWAKLSPKLSSVFLLHSPAHCKQSHAYIDNTLYCNTPTTKDWLRYCDSKVLQINNTLLPTWVNFSYIFKIIFKVAAIDNQRLLSWEKQQYTHQPNHVSPDESEWSDRNRDRVSGAA